MGEGGGVEGTHPFGGMGAAAGDREMRAFDMKAEEAAIRLRLTLRGQHGLDRAGQDLGGIGDDGGQDADSAKVAMGGGHPVQGLGRLVVVQQSVAAAVDLQVEKARGESALEAADGRAGRGRFGKMQAAALGHGKRGTGAEPGAVEDRVGDQPKVGFGTHDRGPVKK